MHDPPPREEKKEEDPKKKAPGHDSYINKYLKKNKKVAYYVDKFVNGGMELSIFFFLGLYAT